MTMGGTAGDGQRSERDYVLSEAGKHSYDVGRRFLEHAGLEGKLDISSACCTNAQFNGVIFTLPHDTSLQVVAEKKNNHINIMYQRGLSTPMDSDSAALPALVRLASLYDVLQEACTHERYRLRANEINGQAQVKISTDGCSKDGRSTDGYHKRLRVEGFADFIQTIDRMISYYTDAE